MAGNVMVQDVQNLVDPLKGYDFQMTISPVIGPAATTTQILSLRCTATELPGVKIDQIPVDLAAFTLIYPGRARFSHSWTTTLVEGQDAAIILTVLSWMKLTFNWLTGVGSNKADIQSTAQVTMYTDPDTPIMTYSLYGLFPIADPGTPLSMAESRAVNPQITWSFDFFYVDQIAQQGLQSQ